MTVEQSATAIALAAMTAAPRTIRLGEEKYAADVLTLGDWGEYEAWLQDRWLENYRRLLERNKRLTPARREELELEAYNVAAAITVGTPAGKALMSSVPGLAKVLWYSLRGRNPALTEEIICAKIGDDRHKRAAKDDFNRTQGLDKIPDSEGGDPKEAAAP